MAAARAAAAAAGAAAAAAGGRRAFSSSASTGAAAALASAEAAAASPALGAALLNALAVVAPHLPVALGLLLVDFVAGFPLLRLRLASSADAAEALLPLPPLVGASVLFAGDDDPALPRDPRAASASSMPWAFGGFLAAPLARAALAARRLASALSAAVRVAALAAIFLPLALLAPLALSQGLGYPGRARWMSLLVSTLEAAGPAFIKWGQWSATRHDLFPPDACAALERLHASAPAHPYRHTRAAIRRAFGAEPEAVFDYIDPRPLASGSIGQVHRASLSARGAAAAGVSRGTIVIVKVRHPGVGEAIERDFAVMSGAARWASAWVPGAAALRLEDTLKQFAAPLREQVDLSREAQNLFRFNANFRRAKGVSFPQPLYPLVAEEVLVESYEAGTHIGAFLPPAHMHVGAGGAGGMGGAGGAAGAQGDAALLDEAEERRRRAEQQQWPPRPGARKGPPGPLRRAANALHPGPGPVAAASPEEAAIDVWHPPPRPGPPADAVRRKLQRVAMAGARGRKGGAGGAAAGGGDDGKHEGDDAEDDEDEEEDERPSPAARAEAERRLRQRRRREQRQREVLAAAQAVAASAAALAAAQPPPPPRMQRRRRAGASYGQFGANGNGDDDDDGDDDDGDDEDGDEDAGAATTDAFGLTMRVPRSHRPPFPPSSARGKKAAAAAAAAPGALGSNGPAAPPPLPSAPARLPTGALHGSPYGARLAELGSGAMLQMMLVDNWVHSDLHPGNVIVRLEAPGGWLLGGAYRAAGAAIGLLGTLEARAEGAGAGGEGGDLTAAAAAATAERRREAAEAAEAARAAASARAGERGGPSAAWQALASVGAWWSGDRNGDGGSSSSTKTSSGDAPSAVAAAAAVTAAATAAADGAPPPAAAAPVLARAARALSHRLAAARASWLQPRIVLIDVGMATELSADDQTCMLGLFRAFAAMDGRAAARWILSFPQEAEAEAGAGAGVEAAGTGGGGLSLPRQHKHKQAQTARQGCADPLAFEEDMEATFAQIRRGLAEADEAADRAESDRARAAASAPGADFWSGFGAGRFDAHPPPSPLPADAKNAKEAKAKEEKTGAAGTFDSGAAALASVLEHIRRHGVPLPGHICAVVVTTLVLEGWSNQLDPRHSVLEQVRSMFSAAPGGAPWRDRVGRSVDAIMLGGGGGAGGAADGDEAAAVAF